LTDSKQVSNPNEYYIAYDEPYIDNARSIWYMQGRISIESLKAILPPTEGGGFVPSVATLSRWRQERMWDNWADILDTKALELAESAMIQKKAAMLQRHAEQAKEVQDKALDYLREHGFDTSSAAVNAFVKATEIERSSRGVSDTLVKVSNMSNDQLLDKVMEVLQRGATTGQIQLEESTKEESDEDNKD
jgi:hypothetical protein